MVKFSDFLPPLQLPDPPPDQVAESPAPKRKEAVKATTKTKATKPMVRAKPKPKPVRAKESAAATNLTKSSDTLETDPKKNTVSGASNKKRADTFTLPRPSTSPKVEVSKKSPPPVPPQVRKEVVVEAPVAPKPPPPPRLYKVGEMEMSAADIRTTILVVEEMEGAVIATLKRGLEMQSTPGGSMTEAEREEASRASAPTVVTVPAPCGGTREILARTKDDNVDVVNKRFLHDSERKELKVLAEKLPNGIKSGSGETPEEVPTQFKAALEELLGSNEEIELYEVRILIPIKETGVLSLKDYIQNETGKKVKPAPHFEGTSSKMLTEQALKLGIMDS